MMSAVIYLGGLADLIRKQMPISGDESISTCMSFAEFEKMRSAKTETSPCLLHVLTGFGDSRTLEQSKKIAGYAKARGVKAIAYPILPFVVQEELRDEAEADLPTLEDMFDAVVPVDLEHAYRYCGTLSVSEAIACLFKATASGIGMIDRDAAANGLNNSHTYKALMESHLVSVLSKAKEEEDKKKQAQAEKMRTAFRNYIKELSDVISKGRLELAVMMLPSATSSTYYLSAENSELIGQQLENLYPILDRLEADPSVYSANKVRIQGVRQRLQYLLEKQGRK